MSDDASAGPEQPKAGPVFEPVEIPRASDLLAARIREWILEADRQDGEPLPSERELMEQTGLGRSTIREALRSLRSEGLVASKVGPKGGYTVRRPNVQTVIDSVTVFLRGQQFRVRSLIEARLALEPVAAALAANRRTEADLEALETIARRNEACAGSAIELTDENVEFHLAVAQASHNELLVALMTALSAALRDAAQGGGERLGADVAAAGPAHRAIVEAIRAEDPAEAERLMRTHIAADGPIVDALAGDELASEPSRA